MGVAVASSEPFPRKPLWSLRHATHELSAEVVFTNGEWELQILALGALITWRRYPRRTSAVAYATVIQQNLERNGWK